MNRYKMKAQLINLSRIWMVLLFGAFSGVVLAEVTQVPLYLGGGGVPGNMVLVPSVEWPTIESVANQNNTYTSSEEFVGYFDSDKCYLYIYSSTESERYFKPNSLATNRKCSGAGEWSGNFMNWAATQTIDPFRKVLTGGLRIKDTPTETWLEKARHPGQGGTGIYPDRTVNNASEVQGATPFNTANKINIRVRGLGKEMRFSLNDYDENNNPTDYNPGSADSSQDPYSNNRGYEMSVRVSVCDSSVGVEDNCKEYSQGWKPEGLIQQNAESIRFSVFGYLNHSTTSRDGGVLRARQKYVGPRRLEPGEGFVENENTEWDDETGVFIDNPDEDDATDTAAYITDSGVINYLNKFGQLNSGNNKSYDPVSELYYAATRYLKNQGNVPEYSDVSSGSSSDQQAWRDGFPVIENWDDPIKYACQENVLLGIGDANTHRDKNLPGNNTYHSSEPTMPTDVSDDTIDVLALTNHVGGLEGFASNIGSTNSFSGRYNSAYIAGLAWNNHVRDMRSDLPGVQTASTHWVDVLENQVLEAPNQNQYYLAAKYGGFDIPSDFDPDTYDDELEEEWWHSNGETLTANNGTVFKRPDNYYLAGEASKMVSSLKEAFSNINNEFKSSAASVAINSSRLDANTAAFQGKFDSSDWSGDVEVRRINSDGSISNETEWCASEVLDNTDAADRNIYTNAPLAVDPDDALRASTGVEFLWDSIDSAQQILLRMKPDATLADDSVGESRLNYLRGDRSEEQTDDDFSKPFRQRATVLGDIVNSTPQFIHKESFRFEMLSEHAEFSDVTSYADFYSSIASRPPMLYVGANDGMFHAFNAQLSTDEEGNSVEDAGKELFAYVPSEVMSNLYRLTLPGYGHQYYVDGTPRIADAWLGTDMGWRTILAGTTGAGGKSVFVLDVTDPETFTASNVLWEFSHPDMGYTIQQPSIVALPSGEFGVVVTSGYHNSPAANGYIWILNAEDGSIIKEFELDSGDLGSPLMVDINSDRVMDRLYAGDTEGNVWRLDLNSSNPTHWDAPNSLKSGSVIDPFFIEPNGRPITAQLTAALNENEELMLFFGTGSFLRVGDNIVPASPSLDYFYGIIDRDEQIDDHNVLLKQEIITEGVFPNSTHQYRGVTDNQIDNTHYGWYLPLVWDSANGGPGKLGERVVSMAIPRGDRLIFTTLIPRNDPCLSGGVSWLMEVELKDGSRLSYSVFDYSGDDNFNSADFINIGTEDDPIYVPGSGVIWGKNDDDDDDDDCEQGLGIFGTPGIVVDPDGDEFKILSTSCGEVVSMPEAGSQNKGRLSWEQLR